MAHLGYGYGSEFHLLRLLGRHRSFLEQKILSALGYSNQLVEWLDFKYDYTKFIPDREYIGIEFLKGLANYDALEKSWKQFWPSTKKTQNWDAICKIGDEWIIIEAKAHKSEINSSSNASEKSKEFIKERFQEIKNKYGVHSDNDWNKGYYQKANRILFLDYLKTNNIKAKLLFIYFLNGYKKNGIQQGINSKSDWVGLIKKQDNYLGISNNVTLKTDIVNLIIDIL